MIVKDNFLPNPCRVRRDALRAEFVDWPAPDGEIYKRVCQKEVPGLRHSLEEIFGDVSIHRQGYRLNYAGEPPNAAIHSDLGWGSHALVLYLCQGEGGTAFWRHKATGASRMEPSEDLFNQVRTDWDDPEKWEQHGLCEIRFNRAVIYEAAEFHSRWPFEAFGNSPETGRLIAVAFFTPD